MKQILMLLLKVNKSTTKSKKALGGFSFSAAMIKIKENKEKGDLIEKSVIEEDGFFKIYKLKLKSKLNFIQEKYNLLIYIHNEQKMRSRIHIFIENRINVRNFKNKILNELMKTTS